MSIFSLPFSGFNSWQEQVEIARYMNSSPLHDDLPDINLVLSLAGVQDFWTFLDQKHVERCLLTKTKFEERSFSQLLLQYCFQNSPEIMFWRENIKT